MKYYLLQDVGRRCEIQLIKGCKTKINPEE